MHDLVVRQRHREVLAVLVEHRKRQIVEMVAAVDGISREVAQGVVHPAHVPLEREPEPSLRDRFGDAGPRGRFLRNREAARLLLAYHRVERGQEVERFEVLAAAVAVGDPFAGLATVVEIEHGGHRIDTQAVDVKLLEPVERVAEQKIADLVAPVVEDQRAPVLMLALARVGVLVERGAVEPAQREVVLGEMRRHPVEDHTDASVMQGIDEVTEIVWGAEARRRRVVARNLIAPRAVERMLHHRQ